MLLVLMEGVFIFFIVCCVCLVNFFRVVDKLVFVLRFLLVWVVWLVMYLFLDFLLFDFFFFDVNDGNLVFNFCFRVDFVIVFD